MDNSYSDNEITLSPSKVLERLQVLRQLQLLQRNKLQIHQNMQENSSNTEIVSNFSNSTSYNTFRSLLQSPRLDSASNPSPTILDKDLIEGVSVLNLSQISFNVSLMTPRKTSNELVSDNIVSNRESVSNKKSIALDEMPIIHPVKGFENMVLDELEKEKVEPNLKSKPIEHVKNKKPFLRRGEGLARFGVKKENIVIQNTKSLPWKKKEFIKNLVLSPKIVKAKNTINRNPSVIKNNNEIKAVKEITFKEKSLESRSSDDSKHDYVADINSSNFIGKLEMPKGKHPLKLNKGKTWNSVFSTEQDDFLKKLKQSEYYKNYASPTKSVASDISCDENILKLRQERESAEQNLFELIENKVLQNNMNCSFFNKLLGRTNTDISGESTPIVMQKCLVKNPQLFVISPDVEKQRQSLQTPGETCSEYTECTSDTCSSISSCCSCNSLDTTKNNRVVNLNNKDKISKKHQTKSKEVSTEKQCQDDTVTENNIIKENIVEMNAKLVATSELLKDRLSELENEIETFRSENSHLTKLREEIDLERQKFYEEKSTFEQKFHEEKILSEYYLAEEKEKLTKKQQMYERYVREMRGKINKKDKDEVINLKKELSDIKDEIKLKDAKTTSTIARLRNHIKFMEKEKKDLQDEIQKLKKENRNISHSNNMTRRLTNIKYLEEINKKLNNMASKTNQPEINVDKNIKYKSYEIERQSRLKKKLSTSPVRMRVRAKSVPSLNVTSKYAKYFSQRDTVSIAGNNNSLNLEAQDDRHSESDDFEQEKPNEVLSESDSFKDKDSSDDEVNNLEKVYLEKFQYDSSKPDNTSNYSSNNFKDDMGQYNTNKNDNFFYTKSKSLSSNQNMSQYSLQESSNKNQSQVLPHSQKSTFKQPENHKHQGSFHKTCSIGSISDKSKSPVSIDSRSLSFSKADGYNIDLSNSQLRNHSTSSSRTNLNPTEIRKSDGSKELRFPNGNVKHIAADGMYIKFIYYNGDVKENFLSEGRIKYFYAETKTYHTTYPDGLEVLEFPDGQLEKRYKDGSSEIKLANGSIRYYDPKNEHVREEWRFPDGTHLIVSSNGDQRIKFSNGQVEVHTKDHKRREFPDGTVKLVYIDGTSETRYSSGRVRIKDKHGNLIMDSATG